MIEIQVAIFINGEFYKWTLHDPSRDGNTITIYVHEIMPIAIGYRDKCQMKKFAQPIENMSNGNGRVDFDTDELYWEDDRVWYRELVA